jgi:ribA/ribD-fused uncharacterized protein
MKYSIENIEIKNDMLFFWGHQPSKDGKITKTCFSQWWLESFTVESTEYKSAEHYMMAKKAALFNDHKMMEQIINCTTPAEAKKMGREISNYDDSIWLQHRYKIVKDGNYYKFSSNEKLKSFLLSTENKIIVEASPVDAIWGIGMANDHKDCINPNLWKGLNLLGFALMEVRDELKEKK